VHRCEEELQKITNIYNSRLTSLSNYLVEMRAKGQSGSVNYRVNAKIAIFLEQVVKDLRLISDKISDENKLKRNSSKRIEE
jgi:hypothetical protein